MLFFYISAPSGIKVPVKLFADAKMGFVGEFLPKEVGKLKISLLKYLFIAVLAMAHDFP